MSLLSFKGGVHVPHHKSMTEHSQIVVCPSPETLYISMRQHIGAPAKCIVKRGDEVKKGQLIGEASGFISANIHSSVSGKVKKILDLDIQGVQTQVVEIENDFNEEIADNVKPLGDLESITGEEIRSSLINSGLVGMGGAGFPTHVKLSPPPDKKVDSLIINGAECEPYLTNDHRLMLEKPEDIIIGVKLMMKALNVDKAYIGIEANKQDAIKTMEEVAAKYSGVKVVGLKVKYPQGAEKQLIYACTKREVPSGGLPLDAGAVVNNVATAKALKDYIYTGMPLVERVATVTGSAINKPMNVLIKTGMMLSHIIDFAGGVKEDFGKFILGGPMMGQAASKFDIPSTKTTSGLLFLNKNEAKPPEVMPCIKCAKCVDICPIFLQPIYISAYTLANRLDIAEEYSPLDCIECGSCSFICPSNRPLLHSIRVAKRKILQKRRKK